MNRIEATCSRCSTRLSAPPRSVLLDASAPCGWLVCETCYDVVDVPVPQSMILGLIVCGCRPLDAPVSVPHPETRSPGPPFGADDVLAFHELLQDDSGLAVALLDVADADKQHSTG